VAAVKIAAAEGNDSTPLLRHILFSFSTLPKNTTNQKIHFKHFKTTFVNSAQ
jgi:hypothetical protein